MFGLFSLCDSFVRTKRLLQWRVPAHIYQMRFFTILHVSLALMLNYLSLQSESLHRYHTKQSNFFICHFLKYSPHRKMFQTNVVDLNEICYIVYQFFFLRWAFLCKSNFCWRAVWKVRGLAAVRRCYAEGGGDMPSCIGGGNVVEAWYSSF
jgi:hypothetical protein